MLSKSTLSNTLQCTCSFAVAVLVIPAAQAQTNQSGQCPDPCYPTIVDSVQGDCDLDGDVDVNDYNIWSYYNSFPPSAGEPVTPRQGDVNWDGQIDTSDQIIIINQYLAGASLSAIPEIYNVDIDTTLNSDGSITLYDNATSQTICDSEPIYSTHNSGWYPPSGCGPIPCAPYDTDGDGRLDPIPDTDVTYDLANETDDGFDLVITVTNSSSVTRPIGHMRLTGLSFGSSPANTSAVYRDPQFGGKAVSLSGDDPDHNRQYPGRLYAPVHVLEVDGYTLGLSVQYPILEYEHTITFGTRYDNDAWTILFIPNKYYINSSSNSAQDYNADANIAPGEIREYVVSVRIHKSSCCDDTNEWVRTLRPYKRYFKALYGPVRYARDDDPVNGFNIAAPGQYSLTNEYSFTHSSTRAPDDYGWYGSTGTNGWVPLMLEGSSQYGWDRTMLWAAGGRYPPATPNLNLPPQFTSEWANMTNADTNDLDDYPNGSNRTLGLWWGHAGSYPDAWPATSLTTLDPANSTHTSFVTNEMQGALDADADEIGLDAFKVMKVWDSYWWLQELQDTYPGIRFITENQHCDLMHTLAPTFAEANNDDGYKYPEGIPLVDFLNADHEFWGQARRDLLEDYLGHAPSGTEIDTFLNTVAGFGFVPVYMSDVNSDIDRSGGGYEAVESWDSSIPSDLNN